MTRSKSKYRSDDEVSNPNPFFHSTLLDAEIPENGGQTDCAQNRSHAVWSGWLRIRYGGVSAYPSPWTTRWCVLSLESDIVQLSCLELDLSTGLLKPASSIVLDQSSRAVFDKPILACVMRGARLSIREKGSGRWVRLVCEYEQRAKQLFLCVNGLVDSIERERTRHTE